MIINIIGTPDKRYGCEVIDTNTERRLPIRQANNLRSFIINNTEQRWHESRRQYLDRISGLMQSSDSLITSYITIEFQDEPKRDYISDAYSWIFRLVSTKSRHSGE